MKPNQERIDFLLIRDIDAILDVFFDKFGAADEEVFGPWRWRTARD
jgi:hypothetical protein